MKTQVDVPAAAQDPTAVRCDLLKALEADRRFRRDSVLGALFHPGKISYREVSPTDSLHILIDGDTISAHVDDVSPLRVQPDGSSRYAWGRVVAHNVLVLIGDAARRVRGLRGAQRCNLHCDVEWYEDDEDQPAA